MSCRQRGVDWKLDIRKVVFVLCWQVSAYDQNNQTRQYRVQSGCTRPTWQYSICLVPTCRYVDLMQSWKLRSQENLLVCFDVMRKMKSSITPSDRGRNGVHVAKIPWSLSIAPLGQGNRYRNDNDCFIVCQFQWKDLDHDFRVFIVKKNEDSLVPFVSHTFLGSFPDECYNWQLNCNTVHYSYCAVGWRLFEGEAYSLGTSHNLGVTPQEQLENSIFRWPSTGGRTSNVR